MQVISIKPYTPIRNTQSFGKKKSDVTDYLIAENTIKKIESEIDGTKGKIKALQKEYINTPPKDIQDIISGLERELAKANERLTKWQRVKTIIEKKMDLYI